MSESAQHIALVNLLLEHVKIMVGPDNSCFITSDCADGFPLSPQTTEGFRPDIYYEFQSTLIIGEAKTSNDVERIHSKMQYESYIKKCALFSGDAYFIAAVHWMDRAAMNNILKRIKKQYPGDYKIIILESV